MLTHLVATSVGAALAARQRPKTRWIRRAVYGTKTGRNYVSEEFPDSGFLVIFSEDGSQATFQRTAGGGWKFLCGKGTADAVVGMRRDLEGS